MDWLPNIDGMRYFCEQILPIIERVKPDCRVRIVGRQPTREIRALAEKNPLVEVTGTVAGRAAVSVVLVSFHCPTANRRWYAHENL